jgi:ribosomal protein S12
MRPLFFVVTKGYSKSAGVCIRKSYLEKRNPNSVIYRLVYVGRLRIFRCYLQYLKNQVHYESLPN